MGNFLAAPITEKETETGKGNGLFFGVSAMQGWRSSMEDSHIAEVSSSHFPQGCSVFAVCDGHGGKFTADKAAECMVDLFAETMNQRGLFANANEKMPAPKDIGACMRDAYMALDARIKETPEVQYGSDQSGCTAISAFVTSTHIIVANSGDSRSVLAKNGRTVPMSYDHKPKNETERRRIENAGGVVRINRVNGDLAVSRALGDFTYKQRNDLRAEEQQVSAEPDIEVEERDGSEEFLIIACDGIWDVMTNDDACNHVRMLMERGESDMGLIAEDVLDVCLKLGSRDNMSVVVVQFPGAKIGSGDGVAGIRRERAEIEAEAQKDNDTEDDQDETDGATSH
ncbi:hypothetical protein Poli38472_002168 [Pythium oligandrum]|uniref:protein-serine/threonine phosphatase n=1 Tax=Pythium oligandrum TaxID=41045 RepID=A0A8K1FKV9_PYTOL|nr:hypothetical protein Poli38472_002168 [Pythium oligandrum]|eukprot:TMW63227.1 hypothetical protein Poli38472_002168 [Pythium oligandrum]